MQEPLAFYRSPFPLALPAMIKFGTIVMTRSTGNAKFTPLPRPVPCRVNVAVLIPTSLALESNNAPPEFPALMDASVCVQAESVVRQPSCQIVAEICQMAEPQSSEYVFTTPESRPTA